MTLSYSRQGLIDTLKEGIVIVTFEKVNGDIRDLTCTLQDKYLPEQVASKRSRVVSDEVICVWDLVDEAWKSFRVDSVIKYSITTTNEFDVGIVEPPQVDNFIDGHNCLVVGGKEYSFGQVKNLIMDEISDLNEEWYAPENHLILSAFERVIGLLSQPPTYEDWVEAVIAGETTDSFEGWVAIQMEVKYG